MISPIIAAIGVTKLSIETTSFVHIKWWGSRIRVDDLVSARHGVARMVVVMMRSTSGHRSVWVYHLLVAGASGGGHLLASLAGYLARRRGHRGCVRASGCSVVKAAVAYVSHVRLRTMGCYKGQRLFETIL